MKLTLLPRSLASRTILILLIGFAVIQALGLMIHTFNQIKLEGIEEERDMATRAVIIYRHIAAAPPSQRAALVAKEPLPKGDSITLAAGPPSPGEPEAPLPARQIIRASIFTYGIPPRIRPRGLEIHATGKPLIYSISFALPDDDAAVTPLLALPLPPVAGRRLPPPPPPPFAQSPLMAPPVWLTISSRLARPEPLRTPGFASAFLVMSLLGAVMIVWAVRKLLVPVRTLAAAAEQLGRDVINAPNLPETGPSEIVTAAIAFNTMAKRIRRFVEDRTFLLTAIGHDLRTPITRLKLRAEFMEDDEQRTKMLADLDEMEAMVAATLAFGRDVTTSEALRRIDLAVLLRTILDEAADGDPEHTDALSYAGPDHLIVQARPLALKRALTNLIGNAIKYGDAARVRLSQPDRTLVQIDIEDSGPGIQLANAELVFEPFRRLETSRNRETGGAGLGLSIARNIVRAHGGDILLSNPPSGGLRASVTLPV